MQKYKVEEYRDASSLSFKYDLSSAEKKILADIIHCVLNVYRSPTETIPFVKSSLCKLPDLYQSLDIFFSKNPGDYFLRTSNCSPKDAWYQLCSETPTEEEIDDKPITLEEIARDIDILRVNNAEQCLLVLCHSERIYYDMEFDDLVNAVILMPWRTDILLDTETRCFVKNKKLLGFSQYYCDLANGYTSVNNVISMDKLAEKIIVFVNNLVLDEKFPYEDAVIDLAISRNTNDLIFIEINGFNTNTDSCLYEWDQLYQINGNDPTFRPLFMYKSNGNVVELK